MGGTAANGDCAVRSHGHPPGARPGPWGAHARQGARRYEKSFVAVVPSPLYYDGVLYIVKNGGLLTSFDADTGKVAKAGRLTGALGPYSASPVAAEKKVFLASEEGKVTVLKADREWEIIAINDLGEGCYATPALAGGHIYLRTNEALYHFGTART